MKLSKNAKEYFWSIMWWVAIFAFMAGMVAYTSAHPTTEDDLNGITTLDLLLGSG